MKATLRMGLTGKFVCALLLLLLKNIMALWENDISPIFILRIVRLPLFFFPLAIVLYHVWLFLPLCKHAVLIPDVFNVIPELLQDTLQDQLLPTEWQLSLPILDAMFISQDAIFNLWFNIIKWCRLQFNHWWDRQQLLRANLQRLSADLLGILVSCLPSCSLVLLQNSAGTTTAQGAFSCSQGLQPWLWIDQALCFTQSEILTKANHYDCISDIYVK